MNKEEPVFKILKKIGFKFDVCINGDVHAFKSGPMILVNGISPSGVEIKGDLTGHAIAPPNVTIHGNAGVEGDFLEFVSTLSTVTLSGNLYFDPVCSFTTGEKNEENSDDTD